MANSIYLQDENFFQDVCDITYNLSPMINKAFESESYKYLLQGMESKMAIIYLTAAINRMKSKKAEFLQFNPLNGWGNYETALDCLKKLKFLCKANENAKIFIC